MPKFYVESGPIRLTLAAASARQAAVLAFQWSCDKQAEIEADSPLQHLLEAEYRGCQLGDEIRASERGFGRPDAQVFPTVEIVKAWLSCPLPLV